MSSMRVSPVESGVVTSGNIRLRLTAKANSWNVAALYFIFYFDLMSNSRGRWCDWPCDSRISRPELVAIVDKKLETTCNAARRSNHWLTRRACRHLNAPRFSSNEANFMHIRIRRVVGESCGGLSSEMVYLNLCLKYSANRDSARKSRLNGHHERPLRAGPGKFDFSTTVSTRYDEISTTVIAGWWRPRIFEYRRATGNDSGNVYRCERRRAT